MEVGIPLFAICVFAAIGIWKTVPAFRQPGVQKLQPWMYVVLPIVLYFSVLWLFKTFMPEAEAQRILARAVAAVEAGNTGQAVGIIKKAASEHRYLWEGSSSAEGSQ